MRVLILKKMVQWKGLSWLLFLLAACFCLCLCFSREALHNKVFGGGPMGFAPDMPVKKKDIHRSSFFEGWLVIGLYQNLVLVSLQRLSLCFPLLFCFLFSCFCFRYTCLFLGTHLARFSSSCFFSFFLSFLLSFFLWLYHSLSILVLDSSFRLFLVFFFLLVSCLFV